MKKEQIAKKNREKEELRKNEDHIANRVMVVFAAAILMLLGLSYLWRAYDVAATLLAAIRINRILIGVSALGLAVSQAEGRLREAARLGFTSAVLPRKNYDQLKGEKVIEGITLYGAADLTEALRYAMPRE